MSVKASLLAVMLLTVPLFAQQVHVVDTSGGFPVGLLAAAVGAAASGDTVLVKAGAYTEFAPVVIDGKSLTIVGEGSPTIDVKLVVRSLAADQHVTLRGLTLEPSFAGLSSLPTEERATVAYLESAGQLWIEECDVRGGRGHGGGLACASGGPAIFVRNADATTVVRTSLVGGPGASTSVAAFACHVAWPGGDAIVVEDSSLTLHTCFVTGGEGGGDFDLHVLGASGGTGLRASGSQVVVSDVVVQGGVGGDECAAGSASACAGGVGLLLEGGSVLYQQQGAFLGGAGGDLTLGGTAPSGDDQSITAGDTLVVWPAAARSLQVTSPVRENDPATLRYEGQANDTIGLFFSLQPGHALLWFKQGVLALGAPLQGPLVVPIAAPDGVFEVDFPAWPVTGFGLEAANVYGQCFVKPAGASTLLSGPTCLTILADVY